MAVATRMAEYSIKNYLGCLSYPGGTSWRECDFAHEYCREARAGNKPGQWINAPLLTAVLAWHIARVRPVAWNVRCDLVVIADC